MIISKYSFSQYAFKENFQQRNKLSCKIFLKVYEMQTREMPHDIISVTYLGNLQVKRKQIDFFIAK